MYKYLTFYKYSIGYILDLKKCLLDQRLVVNRRLWSNKKLPTLKLFLCNYSTFGVGDSSCKESNKRMKKSDI